MLECLTWYVGDIEKVIKYAPYLSNIWSTGNCCDTYKLGTPSNRITRTLARDENQEGQDIFLKAISVNFVMRFSPSWFDRIDECPFATMLLPCSLAECLQREEALLAIKKYATDPTDVSTAIDTLQELKEASSKSMDDAGRISRTLLSQLPEAPIFQGYFLSDYLRLKALWRQRDKLVGEDWESLYAWIMLLPYWQEWFC